MPRRLVPAEQADVSAALGRALPDLSAASSQDLRLLARHFLALLSLAAPGRSVEVRIPPYAAVQCVPGPRHTRGTPPGVVEMDGPTWVALAVGRTTWSEAYDSGAVSASGERTDLSPYLPLTPT